MATRKSTPALQFKLDITSAGRDVELEFLMSLLSAAGFDYVASEAQVERGEYTGRYRYSPPHDDHARKVRHLLDAAIRWTNQDLEAA
ncbi:MAG: hypothetical protein JSR64_13235 [Nitrospira sp.]|nr:hypothetical protein [Nitrospira sp.]